MRQVACQVQFHTLDQVGIANVKAGQAPKTGTTRRHVFFAYFSFKVISCCEAVPEMYYDVPFLPSASTDESLKHTKYFCRLQIRSISTLIVSRGLSITISVSYNTVGKDTEERKRLFSCCRYLEVFHLVEITNLPPTPKFIFESMYT